MYATMYSENDAQAVRAALCCADRETGNFSECHCFADGERVTAHANFKAACGTEE